MSLLPKPVELTQPSTGRCCPSLLLVLVLVLGAGKATGQAPLPVPVAPASPSGTATATSPAVTALRVQPILASSRGLRVLLSSDEPTGIYFDRDTVETQTDIVLSFRVYNDDPNPRRVAMGYSIVDADGKVHLAKTPVFQVPARGLLHRRELFSAPGRGAFVLRFEAAARRDGPDDRVKAELPFAVVVAPSAGYRPQTFFALDAPLLLSPSELDLFKRLGARALRSPWPGGGDQAVDVQPVDAQLQERLNREIATIGVLPAQLTATDETGSSAWAHTILPLLARYRTVRTWEIEGVPTQGDLLAINRSVAQLRPAPLIIGNLPPAGLAGAVPSFPRLAGFDGVAVPLPVDTAGGREENPAATLRLLMSRQKSLKSIGGGAFYVRRGQAEIAPPELPERDALSAAGALVAQHMLAVMAGAEGMSTSLDMAVARDGRPRFDSLALARGAVFAAMTRTLEDTVYHGDLYPRSPELWGAMFKGATSATAVLWTARPGQEGRLKLRLEQGKGRRATAVRVLDLFGNSIATGKSGTTLVPLRPQPVYVIAETEPEVLARALRSAEVEGLRPLAAQVLPLPFQPGAPGAKPPLQVRLQNTLLQPVTGVLQLSVPEGWVLGRDVQQFKLAPGETRVYDFVVNGTRPSQDGSYPVMAIARTEGDRWQWKQAVRVAVAQNVLRGQPVRVDGDLAEWQDVAWMEMKSGAVTSRLAVRWDARRLYLAAYVVEPTFQPRRPEEATYHFWKNSDAVQVAFGLRDQVWSQPARGPFRDTDYGFLMAPFLPGVGGGRLLRLWTPTTPAGGRGDHVRWGGAVPGSSCAIRRNESDRTTMYEACMPLSEMPDLQPLLRAQRRNKLLAPVRFGWLLHDDREATLEWSRATSVFPWWNNTNSFLPYDKVHFAVQNPLGFFAVGSVDDGLTPQPRLPSGSMVEVSPSVPPLPRPTFTPRPTPTPVTGDWSSPVLPPLPAGPPPSFTAPVPTATPTPRPTATARPRRTPRAEPPRLPPMPPSMLPPAAPPPDGSLPPSLPPQ